MRAWRAWGIAAGAAVAGLGCSEPAAQAPPPAPAVAPAVWVETAQPRRDAIAPRLLVSGSLVARRESEIGAEVTGRIERVFVDVGDRVEAGAALFQIEPSSYRAALRQAEAGLDLARAEREQLEADLARARLLEAKQVLATQETERLETRLAVARARERQARAARSVARQDLDKTRARAPYAGTVVARLADEGTTARSMPQTVVLVIQETGQLEGQAGLPEDRHAEVRVGDPARLWVEGRADPIETRVSAVSDAIDRATRTFLVRMLVPNPDRALKAGAFARVEIEPRTRRQALLVPRAALRSEAGRTTVLAVREGRAVELAVRIGAVTEGAVEVLSGLDAETRVIVGEAARELAPGTPVRARGEPDSSA